MSGRKIIMNFSVPPSLEDMEVIAAEILTSLPEELAEFCDDVAIHLEELPDETIEQEMELDDPFDLLALYRNGSEISPGVELKSANDDDVLILFRRPILDMWCETQEDLSTLLRQLMVEELGRHYDFSDDEIDEMNERHHQGML